MFQPVVVPTGNERTRARGNALMSNKHGNDKHVAKMRCEQHGIVSLLGFVLQWQMFAIP